MVDLIFIIAEQNFVILYYLWYHLQNQIAMREYAKKPESQSRTLDSSPRASRQAPIDVILQQYKERNVQRYTEDEELIQGKFDTAQREEIGKDELLQRKPKSVPTSEQNSMQREKTPNNTGLPDNLKTGIENLSGFSLDDVKVHYNSNKPAQLNALAYTQGTDIHVAPGQEKHLPHEAWHVIQQKQGRVQPTMQFQGVSVNDNKELEKEADLRGNEASYSKKTHPLFKDNSLKNRNSTTQLIRIRLRNEDIPLLDELRLVRIDNQGSQTALISTGLDDLNQLVEIDKAENIILEGHGITNEKGVTHGQGGWSCSSLAKFANKVPKPHDWSGSIILLGCSTGAITEDVSKEYYRLTKKMVTVTGTLKNIKVAKDNSNGENFIGTDWSHYSKEEQPHDFEENKRIVNIVESGMGKFLNCIAQFLDILKWMTTGDNFTVNNIPHDLSALELNSKDLIHTESRDAKFKFREREIYYQKFQSIINIIIDNTIIVNKTMTSKSQSKLLSDIQTEALSLFIPLGKDLNREYIIILQQIRGLLLNRIDLTNSAQVKQSRMEETSIFGGFFGESWKERIR